MRNTRCACTMETSRRLDLSLPLCSESKIFLAFWIPTIRPRTCGSPAPRRTRTGTESPRPSVRDERTEKFTSEYFNIISDIIFGYFDLSRRPRGTFPARRKRRWENPALRDSRHFRFPQRFPRSLCADRSWKPIGSSKWRLRTPIDNNDDL